MRRRGPANWRPAWRRERRRGWPRRLAHLPPPSSTPSSRTCTSCSTSDTAANRALSSSRAAASGRAGLAGRTSVRRANAASNAARVASVVRTGERRGRFSIVSGWRQPCKVERKGGEAKSRREAAGRRGPHTPRPNHAFRSYQPQHRTKPAVREKGPRVWKKASHLRHGAGRRAVARHGGGGTGGGRGWSGVWECSEVEWEHAWRQCRFNGRHSTPPPSSHWPGRRRTARSRHHTLHALHRSVAPGPARQKGGAPPARLSRAGRRAGPPAGAVAHA